MLVRRGLLTDRQLTERQEKSFQILELLRQGGARTRTELSQGTGFNIVTVSNYINQFIKSGLVVEKGFDISTGGRKPVLVELNAKSGFAVGIDLGPVDVAKSHTIAVITDLRGHVVHRLTKPRTLEDMDHVLQEAETVIRETLDTSPIDVKKIQGIGIGLPGMLDERAGTVRDTAKGGTRTNFVALRDAWETAFNLPVLVGNGSTLAGYGEVRLGLDRSAQNVIYFYSDVGTSLIIHGSIYWGSGGSAGKLGVLTSTEDDYLSWIKSPSFTVTNVWDLGLTAQAKKLIQEGHATTIEKFALDGPDSIDLFTVVRAAQGGDALAKDLVENAAMQLGVRIAGVVNLLNPEIVIIGGGIEQAGSLVLEPVWRAVQKYAFEEPAALVDILPAQLGENAVALGGACWVIREAFLQA